MKMSQTRLSFYASYLSTSTTFDAVAQHGHSTAAELEAGGWSYSPHGITVA